MSDQWCPRCDSPIERHDFDDDECVLFACTSSTCNWQAAAAVAGRSYADRINEPLSAATIVALREALKSGDYAKFRKARSNTGTTEAPPHA